MGMLQLLSDQDFHPQRELFSAGEIGVIGDIADMNRTKLNWRRNLWTYSDQFDNAVWTKTRCSVNPDTSNSPVGTGTADELIENTDNNTHILSRVASCSPLTYTLSVYAKSNGRNWFSLQNGSLVGIVGHFNLDTGEIGVVGASCTAAISSGGDGWYRCSITFQAASGNNEMRIRLGDADNSPTYLGDGASGILIDGYQLELGSTPSEYQPILDGATNFKLAFPNHAIYQDSNGVTPVTAVGDLVGLVVDKSQGGLDALGPELVTNGGFDADSDWTKGTGWSISGGKADYSTGAGILSQDVGLIANRWYRIDVELTVASSITFRVYCGNSAITINTAVTTSGAYTFYAFSAGVNSSIGFSGSSTGSSYSIDNISVREIPGHHIYQSTSGSRPALSRVPFGGRRNLLNESERFDQAYWSKSQSTVTANAVANPLNGEITADKLVDNATTNIHQVSRAVSGIASGGTYTFSFLAKSAELSSLQVNASGPFTVEPRASITLTGDGTATVAQGDAGTATDIVNLGDGWYECSLTFVTNAATDVTVAIRLVNSSAFYLGNGTDGLYLFGAQFEAGSLRTNYQRTAIAGTVVDCVEQGVPDCWYLDTSSNKWMQTAAIDFTGTDEMTVIAGVRKLSDAARGLICEISSVSTNPGAFYLAGPDTNGVANYAAYFDTGNYYQPTTYTAPNTSVFAAILKRSASSLAEKVITRFNGELNQTNGGANAPSTGNFGNYVLYIGSRAGSSLYFNGHIFYLLVRGKTTSGSKLTRAEKYIAKKTGLTI